VVETVQYQGVDLMANLELDQILLVVQQWCQKCRVREQGRCVEDGMPSELVADDRGCVDSE